MKLSHAQRDLRDGFFKTLLEAVFPLKTGPDQELTLELLIDAAQLLKEHLEQELQEIRLEQTE